MQSQNANKTDIQTLTDFLYKYMKRRDEKMQSDREKREAHASISTITMYRCDRGPIFPLK